MNTKKHTEFRNRGGRPSIRTRAIENAICRRIACGESLPQICADPKMPCRDTFHRWLRKDAKNYRLIREAMEREFPDGIPAEQLDRS